MIDSRQLTAFRCVVPEVAPAVTDALRLFGRRNENKKPREQHTRRKAAAAAAGAKTERGQVCYVCIYVRS